MTLRQFRDRVLQQEDLNFLLTNRIPRILLTRFMGWFSQIRQPLVRALSIRAWQLFAELDLRDAKKQHFDSLHDCFIRELKPGARTIDADPDVLVSPCDAIIGACGPVQGLQVFQAKGFGYTLPELFGADAQAFAPYRDGCYATLRLTSSMYHRFHAPHDCRVHHVTHHAGDTWNVNPIALKRVQKLFCRNERAVIHTRLGRGGHPIALVPVAAILVASLRLHWLSTLLGLGYRGPDELPCDAGFLKGQEMGWFQHGSTIIVFAPRGFVLAEGLASGCHLRMGQALMRLPVGTEDLREAPHPSGDRRSDAGGSQGKAGLSVSDARQRGTPSIPGHSQRNSLSFTRASHGLATVGHPFAGDCASCSVQSRHIPGLHIPSSLDQESLHEGFAASEERRVAEHVGQ